MIHDERLQALLRQADAGEASVGPTDLVGQIRRLDRWRRRRNRVFAGAAACVAAIAIFSQLDWPRRANVPTQTTALPAPINPETPSLSDENIRGATEGLPAQDLAELDSQLRVARQVSQILCRDLEVNSIRRVAPQLDPWQVVKTEFEVVAYQMLCRADELRIAMQPDEPVIAAYQKLVELFPHTPAAEVARGRLAKLQY